MSGEQNLIFKIYEEGKNLKYSKNNKEKTVLVFTLANTQVKFVVIKKGALPDSTHFLEISLMDITRIQVIQ